MRKRKRKRKAVTGWIELHIEKLHGFYYPSKIILVIKLRRVLCKGSYGAET
jgi:hypothetical protein